MKINRIGVLVLALAFGCLGKAWAFPVDFVASFADTGSSIMAKVEGNKLRLSVTNLSSGHVDDYLMNSDSVSIAESSGTVTASTEPGWLGIRNQVVSSLQSIKDGLEASGDTSQSAALDTTIAYVQSI